MPEHPRARELVEPTRGKRLLVRCDRPGCERAVLLDPQRTFGSRATWPAEGRSSRFRCACGSREARVPYTRNASQPDGPVSPAAISLWF